MHSLRGFMIFGLDAFLLESVDKNIVQPYYKIIAAPQEANTNDRIVNAFKSVINNPKFKKATSVRLKQKLPEATEYLIFITVEKVPSSDILQLAEIIFSSDVLEMLIKVSDIRAELKQELLARCPENKKHALSEIT